MKRTMTVVSLRAAIVRVYSRHKVLLAMAVFVCSVFGIGSSVVLGAELEAPLNELNDGTIRWECHLFVDESEGEDDFRQRNIDCELARRHPIVVGNALPAFAQRGFPVVDLRRLFGCENEPRLRDARAALAVSHLQSEAECDAWVQLASGGFARVEVNGVPILSIEGSGAVDQYSALSKVHLKKGCNTISCFAIEGDRDFAFAVSIDNHLQNAVFRNLQRKRSILKKMIIAPGEKLELNCDFGVDGLLAADIEDGNSRRTISIPSGGVTVNSIPVPGIYTLRVNGDGGSISQRFIVGDPDECLKRIIAGSNQTITSPEYLRTIEPYLKRLATLSRADQIGSTISSEWDRTIWMAEIERKTVSCMDSIVRLLPHLKHDDSALKDPEPGLWIRSFESNIDGQMLSYRVFLPSGSGGDSTVPVVYVAHPPFTHPREYLNGVQVANQAEAERWGAGAQHLGIAIVWLGYRSCPYGGAMDVAHAREVIDDAEHVFRFNKRKRYLYAECGAGLTAVRLLANNPSFFAGVLMVNPDLHRYVHRHNYNNRFARFPDYKSWLLKGDSFSAAVSNRTRVEILFDSEALYDGKFAQCLEYVRESGQLGIPRSVDRPAPTAGDWFDGVVLPRLQELVKEEAVEEPRLLTKETPRGVLGIFTEPFCLVLPSELGPSGEADRQLVTRFEEMWKRANFVGLRSISDKECTDELLRSYNIVLLGSSSSNLVWRRLQNELVPAGKIEGGVQLGAQLDGPYVAVMKHPNCGDRRLLVVYGGDSGGAFLRDLDLSIDGWFDFAIWTKTGDGFEIAKAELYRAE